MKPLTLSLLVLGAALAGPVQAHAQGVPETPAALVAVSIQIDGRPVSLFPAPDGSGRYYLEACAGSRYAVALANRTGERVGVVLTVDGLNAISGERDSGRGRMYVLDPWQSTSVQGWRSSLQEVRQFTFVDERRSYATRIGQGQREDGLDRGRGLPRAPRVRPGAALPVRRAAATLPGRGAGEARARAGSRGAGGVVGQGRARLRRREPRGTPRRRSYPGTGWGERTHDPVVLVSFDPEAEPRERVTLRYEYRPALVALGVLPPRTPPRDRLWQRDQAEPGFAQAPRW